jgi:molybdopterin converting factor small subunit
VAGGPGPGTGPQVSGSDPVRATAEPGAGGAQPAAEGGSSVLVRYFAGARAAAGVAEERIRLSGRGSVADALAAVQARRGPALVRVLPACSFLLNGVAVRDHAMPVPDGGELDVLPPFAGG